jgi:hypothetical protein
MSRSSSDAKQRRSKKYLAVIEDLKRDLEARKVIKPEPKPDPIRRYWMER